MSERIIKYSVRVQNLEKVGDYLEKSSSEYGFSEEEKESVFFIDENGRIFAILNEGKKEIKLAPYTNLKIIKGIEKLVN